MKCQVACSFIGLVLAAGCSSQNQGSGEPTNKVRSADTGWITAISGGVSGNERLLIDNQRPYPSVAGDSQSGTCTVSGGAISDCTFSQVYDTYTYGNSSADYNLMAVDIDVDSTSVLVKGGINNSANSSWNSSGDETADATWNADTSDQPQIVQTVISVSGNCQVSNITWDAGGQSDCTEVGTGTGSVEGWVYGTITDNALGGPPVFSCFKLLSNSASGSGVENNDYDYHCGTPPMLVMGHQYTVQLMSKSTRATVTVPTSASGGQTACGIADLNGSEFYFECL